jgi:hypothetical protein
MWALVVTNWNGTVLDVAVYKRRNEAITAVVKRAKASEYFDRTGQEREAFRKDFGERMSYDDGEKITSVVCVSRSVTVS